MTARDTRFATLRTLATADVAQAIADLVESGSDEACHRVNAIEFAAERGLSLDAVVDGFVHASKLGLFDMSWNMLCPGCGGLLDASASVRDVKTKYACTMCTTAYAPTLDEMVEVSFTVSPAVRPIRAHDPDAFDPAEYYRHAYFGQGLRVAVGEDWRSFFDEVTLTASAVAPREKIVVDLQFPAAFLIAFDPVTHHATFFDVKGEPVEARRELDISFRHGTMEVSTHEVAPGPVRLRFHNTTDRRIVPGLFLAGDRLHEAMHQRRDFFTAKHLLSNQTFRDIYRTDTLAIDQRLSISSLTFLFTDLKSSTELYERVGDLVAYELVEKHFRVLGGVVREAGGAVVKTIGDAIMATFPSPDRGLRAALAMRDAMMRFNQSTTRDDLLVKIGLHAGPCLAVMFNDRLDYFGTTVNTAARVQSLAGANTVLTTDAVLGYDAVRAQVDRGELLVSPQRTHLRGLKDEVTVYDVHPRAV